MSGEYFNQGQDVRGLAQALEGGLPTELVPEGISSALVSAAFSIADGDKRKAAIMTQEHHQEHPYES